MTTVGVIFDLTVGRATPTNSNISNAFQYKTLCHLANCKNLINVMVNVGVESKIHLLIRSDKSAGLQIFDDFAVEIAKQRRWTVSTMKSVKAAKNDRIVGRRPAQRKEAFENEAGSDQMNFATSFQSDITESTVNWQSWLWTLQPNHCGMSR